MGNIFSKEELQPNIARAVKKGEPLEPYDYSILLIGASGNGKSAFLNCISNVIMEQKLTDLVPAIKCEKYPNIGREFEDGLKEKNTSKCGLSQTKNAYYYKLNGRITGYKTILLVDTPGFSSDRGVDCDNGNIKTIIQAALRVTKFNSILFFEKVSTNRLNPIITYQLYRIAEIIPKDFESKVILVLTFYHDTVAFDKQWLPFKIQQTCKINNFAFEYSSHQYSTNSKLLKKKTKEWRKYQKKIEKLSKKIFQMNAESTLQYSQIFENHNNVMEKIAEYRVLIENFERILDYLNNRQSSNILILKWVTTTYYNTICTEHRIVCHEDCSLDLKDVAGTDFFKNCACMGFTSRCKKCGCISEQHVHKFEKPESKSQTISDILNELSINKNEKNLENVKKAITKKKNDIIIQLGNLELKIHEICPNYKLSKYFSIAIEILQIQNFADLTDDKRIELSGDINVYKQISDSLNLKSIGNS